MCLLNKTIRFLPLLLLALAGCSTAQQNTANTTASYEMTPCGQGLFCPKVFYSSNKDQQGFTAKIKLDENGKPKEFDVSTNANTPNQAITAAAETNKEISQNIGKLLDLGGAAAQGAIKGGALGGGPGAGIGAVTGALQGKANAGAGAAPIP